MATQGLEAARAQKALVEAQIENLNLQLARTEVRAPFDGVVSERKASVGDTAAIGKELVKVIDPRSMRFEGTIVAAHAFVPRKSKPSPASLIGRGPPSKP